MKNTTASTSKFAHLSAVPSKPDRDGCPTTVVQLFDRRQPRAVENAASSLEAMPHLVERICLLWGQGEFETYVNRLIMDSRDGARQGLPWQAAQELLFLAELSMAKRALHAAEITGVPFQQMFARCLETAERTGHIAGGLALEPKDDPWGDPRANPDARNCDKGPQAGAAGNARPREKSGWWK
jgi:hypothetical protein